MAAWISAASSERSIMLRWVAAGVFFAAALPLTGWFLAMSQPGVDGVSAAHRAQPVLYIVDLAPFVLCIASFGIGAFHARLVRIRHSIEHTVQVRTEHLHRALRELSDAQSELLSAQKLEAIGGLAAGIAHEINTPIQYVGDNTKFIDEALSGLLAVAAAAAGLVEAVRPIQQVSGLVDVYEKAAKDADLEFLTAEIPTAISESLAGIEQVASIVRALKSFAHPGSDEKAAADINEMIETTVAVARNEWKYVAEMDLGGLDPELPMVPVLAGPLKQVVLNMIIYAAHAIAEKADGESVTGRICISTGVTDGRALIRVADNGTGIPREVRERIFEPFFTTKEVGKGSGQGLAIARSIIVRHGGSVTFETTPGVGTEFVIGIPLEASEPVLEPGELISQ